MAFGRGSTANRFHVLWLPLLIGIGYVGLQSLDLSQWAPEASLGQLESLSDSDKKTISIYPTATRSSLVDLVIASGFFFATTLLVRRTGSISRLMIVMLLTGALVGFFGILQSVSWNGQLFWQYEMTQQGLAFGPFVNRNNAAGFLVMALCCGLYLSLIELFRWQQEANSINNQNARGSGKNKSPNWWSSIVYFFAKIESRHLYIMLGVSSVTAGVLMTLSRGGVLAMLLVLAGVAVFTMFKRQLRLPAMVAAILIGLGIGWFVSALEFDRKLADRVETITELELDQVPRLKHWQDMLPLVKQTTLGTGAGTYRYVSPEYQTFEFDRVFAHAENIYLETFIELGYPGAILLLLTIVGCLIASLKLVRHDSIESHCLGVFGLLILLGTAAASLFDFGLYQPANYTFLAIALGMVVAKASQVSSSDHSNGNLSTSRLSTISIGLVVMLFLISIGWTCWFSFGTESLRSVRRNVTLANAHMDASDALLAKKSLNSMQARLARVKSICPDSAELHIQLGELDLLRFRKSKAKELSAYVNEQLASQISEAEKTLLKSYTAEKIWTSTSLHSANRELKSALQNNLPSVTLNEFEQQLLKSAYQNFTLASKLRRFDWETHLRLAQLEPILNPELKTFVPKVKSHLKIALRRPYPSPQMLFDCGLVYLNAGVSEKAVELWSLCLRKRTARKFERPIVELSMSDLPMPPFFEKVLPQKPEFLLRVAKNYFRAPELILPKRLLLIHTERVIQNAKGDLNSADYHFFLAETASLSDQYKLAAKQYELALQERPSEVVWRFEYARCLNETRQYSEAIRQLQKCQLEKSPIFPRIKPLMERIRNKQKQEARTNKG